MEVYSYIFDFSRSPTFFERWNYDFKVEEMKQDANNFEVVYCTHAPENINDCLTGGVLNNNVTVATNGVCNLNLKYDDGVISVRSDSTFNIGEAIIPLKAIFIRNKSSKFVMGYSINNSPFDVTNQVVIEANTILWSLVDGESV